MGFLLQLSLIVKAKKCQTFIFCPILNNLSHIRDLELELYNERR